MKSPICNRAAIRNAIGFLSLVVLGLASVAKATVIASDDFSSDTAGSALSTYPSSDPNWNAGYKVPASGTNGTAIDGAVSSANLVYGANTFGAASTMTGGATNALDFRVLQNPLTLGTAGSPNVLYVSALMKQTQTGVSPARIAFLSLYQYGGAIPVNNSVQAPNLTSNNINTGDSLDFGSNGSNWYMNVQGGINGSMNVTGTGAAVTEVSGILASTTALLVVELDYNGGGIDKAKFYIDPTSTSSGSATFVGEADNLTLPQIGMLRVFAGNPSGSNTNTASYDNITFATTFADAVSLDGLVPEPGSLGLLALGSLGLLARRRRRIV